MSESNRPSSSRLFQAVGQAIMGILVFLACWRVTHYIGIQQRNLSNALQTTREQIAAGRPVAENYEKFLSAVVEYLKTTRDQNIVLLMQQSGVPVRIQDAPPSGAGDGASGAKEGAPTPPVAPKAGK